MELILFRHGASIYTFLGTGLAGSAPVGPGRVLVICRRLVPWHSGTGMCGGIHGWRPRPLPLLGWAEGRRTGERAPTPRRYRRACRRTSPRRQAVADAARAGGHLFGRLLTRNGGLSALNACHAALPGQMATASFRVDSVRARDSRSPRARAAACSIEPLCKARIRMQPMIGDQPPPALPLPLAWTRSSPSPRGGWGRIWLSGLPARACYSG